MYERRLVLPNIPEEPNDTPKEFTNIDDEDFEFNWDSRPYRVGAGETITFPKYLVNYGADHLARKIVKREALEKAKKEGKSPNEHMGADVKTRDEEKQWKLMKKIAGVVSEKKEEKEEKSPEKLEEKSWTELRTLASKLGKYKVGMKREDVIKTLRE